MIYQVYMYMDHIVLENTFIILHLRIKELHFSFKSHVSITLVALFF